jgi:hypothetical protein
MTHVTQKPKTLTSPFYKESVSRYETIRTRTSPTPKEQHLLALKPLNGLYRNLGDFGHSSVEFVEAQQVLRFKSNSRNSNNISNASESGTNRPSRKFTLEVEILQI